MYITRSFHVLCFESGPIRLRWNKLYKICKYGLKACPKTLVCFFSNRIYLKSPFVQLHIYYGTYSITLKFGANFGGIYLIMLIMTRIEHCECDAPLRRRPHELEQYIHIKIDVLGKLKITLCLSTRYAMIQDAAGNLERFCNRLKYKIIGILISDDMASIIFFHIILFIYSIL